jgi:LPXTG-site transpeptidase (sortase) family protein
MTEATIPAHLRLAERCLWLACGTLSIAFTLITLEAHYTAHLPVPASVTMNALPGETTRLTKETAATRGRWLARLDAPSLGLSATVLEGSDESTLRRGAGHIEGTALPGPAGNVGIAGHRDTIFRPLRRVKSGDTFLLTTSTGAVLEYVVSATRIVQPTDVYVLDATSQPTLTLVTCFPFGYLGNAPLRFVVSARLVGTKGG